MNSKDVTVHVDAGSVVKAIAILALAYVLFILRDLLLVILTAVVFASAVEPITKWFVGYRFPRLLAVILIYLGLAVSLTLTFYLLFVPVLNEASNALSSLSQYISTVNTDAPVVSSSFLDANPAIRQFSGSFSLKEIAQQINLVVSNVSGGIFNTISLVFGGLLSFLLILVLSFYLAVQEDGIPVFLNMVTPARHRSYVISLWRRAEKKIGLWMQGQLVLVVLVAVLIYLGLTLLGVEHALLLAILGGILEIIPLFGPVISSIPAILTAFSQDGWSLALIVMGLYIIIQQFENQLIYPLVVKKVVGVPSIVVILALIIGAKLGGFLGILLSVPLAAILLEFLNDLQRDMLHPEKNA
ncbi:MAG: AI-2E family transporter [Patescibacteria group bacterium]|nr:AI-2E family transporter [bacterium]MDZ4241025.1 AI-2E family transporter [Patescibacteria group bacterium]